MNLIPAWLQITTSISTTVGVLIALYVAVWREPRKARRERDDRDAQATEDRDRYNDQMAALQRAEDDRIAAQARKIVPEIASGDRFGENIWLAHIQNASTGVINDLRVVVIAYDDQDVEVTDGVQKATGQLDISGAMEKIISDAVSGGVGGLMNSGPMAGLLRQQQQFGMGAMGMGYGQPSIANQMKNAMAQQIKPQVSAALRQAMIGQIQSEWPPSLGPGASTSVAYRATRSGLRLRIGIRFEDEAGYVWNRINTDQPTRDDPS
ncbi:hypothetical protein [Mycolicibacterium fluoranthenivorans]|uniref:Uncharacterized protein n=1 Tax=Mycolicibacterium fluoranthenivorans TaxID=258505 RepID=A0A7X5U4V7_9MYCO|nr:hypothetical protein [Mycolicibacterium fluoranthenivorans]MCV7355938.1 hypothetical protein [Mycolicibacterium fluoranthenivorans]NIH98408.1 hypothetical protein [Mycolicibacterium fluoranthenivorans]